MFFVSNTVLEADLIHLHDWVFREKLWRCQVFYQEYRICRGWVPWSYHSCAQSIFMANTDEKISVKFSTVKKKLCENSVILGINHDPTVKWNFIWICFKTFSEQAQSLKKIGQCIFWRIVSASIRRRNKMITCWHKFTKGRCEWSIATTLRDVTRWKQNNYV